MNLSTIMLYQPPNLHLVLCDVEGGTQQTILLIYLYHCILPIGDTRGIMELRKTGEWHLCLYSCQHHLAQLKVHPSTSRLRHSSGNPWSSSIETLEIPLPETSEQEHFTILFPRPKAPGYLGDPFLKYLNYNCKEFLILSPGFGILFVPFCFLSLGW